MSRRPTKRMLRFIAWMQWAAFHAPGFTFAESNSIIFKLEAGLTESEKAQVGELWPDDVEIIRKPKSLRLKKPATHVVNITKPVKRPRTAGALPAPKVIA